MIASFTGDLHPVCSSSVRYASVGADQAKTRLTYSHEAVDASGLKIVGVYRSIVSRKSCSDHRVSTTFPYILYLDQFTLSSARPGPIIFHIIALALIICLRFALRFGLTTMPTLARPHYIRCLNLYMGGPAGFPNVRGQCAPSRSPPSFKLWGSFCWYCTSRVSTPGFSQTQWSSRIAPRRISHIPVVTVD